ncbi:hypothetical protein COT20_01770 [bacterium (Candidatus Gribaldobacteria) CG08_land_8_20_14_0_20_39_15]|uniref:Gcp-like domain-containing protein n=1 Tax=bacterium (Candidatus Gribaldobacteria) CG08_land_8_20_14_0_20_39_15 TaxID=2014273 RepID=A0A2M6XUD4_9BACT|nr:MAG: hypothetical protein COT20_01770 [bacterium (Candidatus Gribaldobacteria) CG08_land_8_20_14_0_20_39_15]
MYLYINNLNPGKIILAILNGAPEKKQKWFNFPVADDRDKNILYFIDKIFKKEKRKSTDLRGIIVINGPGAFTSIRIALSITNILAWTLKIPAVGVSFKKNASDKILAREGVKKISYRKIGDLVLPFYGKKPNITKPKK